MNYDQVPGDTCAKGYENCILINSFDWYITRSICSPKSKKADREGTTATVGEIRISKETDSASPNLIRAALGTGPAGEGTKVVISFLKTDTEGPESYIVVTLTNTLVSGWSIASDGDRPTEQLKLNFTEIEFKNTGMGPANETGTPDPAAYDLTTHTGH
jgi:type VI secretion system secreted protein Hcp